ncbi:MAG: hypothetical protein KatS3mg090_0488 [Patescibacteria group bacterium]|nr:MAG: hypothetical protein KatS3mg090_0488 [Patescibacteria group bacterium]
MIRLICGEDEVSAYNYFLDLKNKFRAKGYKIYQGDATNFFQLVQNSVYSTTLFGQKNAFFFEDVTKKLGKNKDFLKSLEFFKSSKTDYLVILDLVDKKTALRYVDSSDVVNFSFPDSLWSLLDSFSPANKDFFIAKFDEVCKNSAVELVFFMLARRLRELISVKEHQVEGMPYWLQKKLQNQAKDWSLAKLYSFIEHFHTIDLRIKTSATPYSLKDLLEIVLYFGL